MSKYKKFLSEWIGKGFISQDQAEKIEAYETAKPGSHWIMRGFLILGAVVIGIGIISVVAANWYFIPDSVKLIVDFLILIGLALGIYQFQNSDKKNVYEVLIVLLMISCLASIGLISQIYHTGGKLYEAVFFWSLITLSVAAISRYSFVPFLWTTAFVGSSFFMLMDIQLFSLNYKNQFNWLGIAMITPMICVLATSLLSYLKGSEKFIKAFRFWLIWTGMMAIACADFKLSQAQSRYYEVQMQSLYPGIIGGGLVMLGLLIRKDFSMGRKFLSGAILLFYVAMFLSSSYELNTHTMGGIFTVGILILSAIHFGSLGNKFLFNTITLFIGVRFLIYYFQAFGGLAYTGVGLILSGVGIIGMVYVWHTNRVRLQKWVEGLIK